MTRGKKRHNKRHNTQNQTPPQASVTAKSGNQAVLGETETNESDDSEPDTKKSLFSGTRTIEYLQLAVNGVLALLGCWALCIYGGQLNTMKGTLTEVKTEFSISHRPWVNISGGIKANGPLIFDSTGAHLSISYTLKNGGTAPAFGTYTISRGLEVRPMPTTPEEIRKIIDCDKSAGRFPVGFPGTVKNASEIIGTLILPSDTFDADNTLEGKNIPSAGPQEVWFPMCIRYEDETRDVHGTGLLWKFNSADGKPIQPNGSIKGTILQIAFGNWAY